MTGATDRQRNSTFAPVKAARIAAGIVGGLICGTFAVAVYAAVAMLWLPFLTDPVTWKIAASIGALALLYWWADRRENRKEP